MMTAILLLLGVLIVAHIALWRSMAVTIRLLQALSAVKAREERARVARADRQAQAQSLLRKRLEARGL